MRGNRSFYEVLSVPLEATPNEIRRAYRELARNYHPDINKSPGAEAMMKEINEAHDILADPEKRAEYDKAIFAKPDADSVITAVPVDAPEDLVRMSRRYGIPLEFLWGREIPLQETVYTASSRPYNPIPNDTIGWGPNDPTFNRDIEEIFKREKLRF